MSTVAEKKKHDKQLDAYASSFNSLIKRLCTMYYAKDGTDISLRTKKRVSLLTNETPMLLIKEGAYILKYAERIKNRDFEYMFNCDFKDEVNYALRDVDKKDQSREQKETNNAILLIKSTFKKCNSKEQDEICNIVENILSTYCQYAMYIKKNNL